METKTQGPRRLGFVLSDGNGNISYDTVTIVSGAGVLEAGTVLGKVTASGKFTISANAEVVAFEGAETALCVLADKVDATDADVEAVLVLRRFAEVKVGSLIMDASVDDDAKTLTKLGQLEAATIIAR